MTSKGDWVFLLDSGKILEIAAAVYGIMDIDQARLAALQMLQEVLPFHQGLFWLAEPITHFPLGPPVTVNLPPEVLQLWLKYCGIHGDQAFQNANRAGKTVFRSTGVLDYDQWTESPAYHLVYGPAHTYYELACELKEGQMVYGALVLFRPKSAEDFSLDDVGTLEALYPHLVNRLRWHHLKIAANRSEEDASPSAGQPRTSPSPFNLLSEREMAVANLVIWGASNQEIAEALKVSINTVKMHLKHIYGKLEIKHRNQISTLFLTTFHQLGSSTAATDEQ